MSALPGPSATPRPASRPPSATPRPPRPVARERGPARPGPRMREGSALPGAPGAAAPVPGFLAKLWALVEDPQSDDVICWSRVRAARGALARPGTAARGAGSRGRRRGAAR